MHSIRFDHRELNIAWRKICKFFSRLGIRLSLLSMTLIAVLTIGSAMIVIEIMDRFLFSEMVKRGSALSISASSPAGYSILAEDLLGLDHLAAKIKESQNDVLYVAINDQQGRQLAHSQLGGTVATASSVAGTVLLQQQEVVVRSGTFAGKASFDFDAPIIFQGEQLGTVQLGIDATTLATTRQLARRQILFVTTIILVTGAIASFILTRIVTQPVARLSEGVARLKSGQYTAPITTTSQDELGDLTRDFNAMAAELLAQKERLDRYAVILEESYRATVKILGASIESRDRYTLGHSQRVAKLSLMIGNKLDLDQTALKDLEIACFLHDVGKIKVPDRIISKEGKLDDEEYTLMSQHPQHGAEILKLAASLQRFIPVVLSHHERYDGRGYPNRLKGEEIPLFAAIVAIADCYDAMTSNRPYRVGLPASEAIAEIQRCRGTQFSPRLVDLFIEAMNEGTQQPMSIMVSA